MQSLRVIFVLFTTLSVVVISSLPLDSEELENMTNCKELCGECGCLGFYCGDECLCECDGDGEEDGTCISKIQDKCYENNLPYEVLIQGSSGNRLVRSLYTDPSENNLNEDGVCIAKDPANRKERNTFSIYQPSKTHEDASNTNADGEATPETDATLMREIELYLESQLVPKDDNEPQNAPSRYEGNDKFKRHLEEIEGEPEIIIEEAEEDEVSEPEATIVEIPADEGEEVVEIGDEEGDEVGSPNLLFPPIVPAAPAPVTPTPTPKQLLEANLESLKTQLVAADTVAIDALRAKQAALKGKLLSDLAASRAAINLRTEAVKAKLSNALAASKVKLAAASAALPAAPVAAAAAVANAPVVAAAALPALPAFPAFPAFAPIAANVEAKVAAAEAAVAPVAAAPVAAAAAAAAPVAAAAAAAPVAAAAAAAPVSPIIQTFDWLNANDGIVGMAAPGLELEAETAANTLAAKGKALLEKLKLQAKLNKLELESNSIAAKLGLWGQGVGSAVADAAAAVVEETR